METERWIVTYSEQQGCFHRELLSEYLSGPANGFVMLATFDTCEACGEYIEKRLKAMRNENMG
jgi:hypothetical protein